MTENSDSITIKELSELLKVSVPTTYRYLKHGTPTKRSRGRSIEVEQIPSYYVGGKKFFSKSAALELIEESKGMK